MDMNVNGQKIKSLRKLRLWSQEELAVACDVSLRTIQRAEGEGQASSETTKALLAVFEIDSEQLLKWDQQPQKYVNVQLAYPIILIFLAVGFCATWALTQEYLRVVEFLVLMSVCAVVLCLFPSLTTRVENGHIKWNFGVGLISKNVPISRVVTSRSVRNKAWWGIGIRMIPGGWLYNVSGLKAVELVLDDGKLIRLGSDEPDEFNQAIIQARDLLIQPE